MERQRGKAKVSGTVEQNTACARTRISPPPPPHVPDSPSPPIVRCRRSNPNRALKEKKRKRDRRDEMKTRQRGRALPVCVWKAFWLAEKGRASERASERDGQSRPGGSQLSGWFHCHHFPVIPCMRVPSTPSARLHPTMLEPRVLLYLPRTTKALSFRKYDHPDFLVRTEPANRRAGGPGFFFYLFIFSPPIPAPRPENCCA